MSNVKTRTTEASLQTGNLAAHTIDSGSGGRRTAATAQTREAADSAIVTTRISQPAAAVSIQAGSAAGWQAAIGRWTARKRRGPVRHFRAACAESVLASR